MTPAQDACDEPTCTAALKKGASGYVSRWTTMAAQREGWFFTRDGEAFCPAHVPAWVGPWRASRAKG